VGLPASSTFDDLLGKAATSIAKKGPMKTAAGASGGTAGLRMGQLKRVSALHLADGQLVHLEMQVCATTSATAERL
jgi:hypothetical protein